MKYRTFFIIIISFLTFTATAQHEELKFLVEEMCKRIDVEEFKSTETETLNAKLQELGKEIYEDYPEKTEAIKEEIQKKYPELSEDKITSIFLLDYVDMAFDKCDKYTEVLLFTLGECPEGNKSLDGMVEAVNKYIEKNKGLSNAQKFSEMDQVIQDYLEENKEQIEKDYMAGLSSIKLIDDSIIYLFHKSKPYLKVMVLGQLEMAYNQMR